MDKRLRDYPEIVIAVLIIAVLLGILCRRAWDDRLESPLSPLAHVTRWFGVNEGAELGLAEVAQAERRAGSEMEPRAYLPLLHTTRIELALLLNPGFEGINSGACWIVDYGEFYTECNDEQDGPAGWVTFYKRGGQCTDTPAYPTGAAEVRVITDVPDPTRIAEGIQAVEFFTVWTCARGGLYQQVDAVPGQVYRFGAKTHAWYSNCGLAPHDPPRPDCETLAFCIDASPDCIMPHAWLGLGINPGGSPDPFSEDVHWFWYEIYGQYADGRVFSPWVRAQTDQVTVLWMISTTSPLRYNNGYLDDAVLETVQ